MRLVWMHILLALLVLMVDGTKKSLSSLENVKGSVDQEQPIANFTKDLKDLIKEEREDEEEEDEEHLPILPPIILLDFTNSSSDEKSKRTVNGNLGYGYDRNNLSPGKYNYYFPAGKSGTTVSIEESISPFQPKTIVESIKPVSEKPFGNAYGGPTRFRAFPTSSTIQSQQQFGSNIRYTNVQPIFGQRTKLQKTTSTDFENYHTFSSTPRPAISVYSTPKSTAYPVDNYSTPRPTYDQGYSTSRPNTYSNPIGTNSYVPGYNVEDYNSQRLAYEGSTRSPIALDPGYSSGSTVLSSLSNFPRYTIENGVKYEHKIVWKYPNGQVSEIGPSSDTNSFSRYNDLPVKPNPTSAGYQNLNSVSSFQNSQRPSYSPTEVYSQNPAQFSKEQIYPDQQTQFVSSDSLPGQTYNSGPQVPQQSYKLRYQPQYSVENERDENLQNGVPSSSTFSRAKQTGSSLYEQRRPVSKYAVASPNPEYTDSTLKYPTNVSSGSSLFTATGQLSPAILGKYTPQVQRYLEKVFAMSKHLERQRYSSSKSYPNIEYSNLLSYNPSISQYIRNPASILNAQPTFVHVGNSLVPVIILRVDGVPPIQPNLTPNINLKALLQRYLTQYASSINNLAQNSNYEVGDEGSGKSQSSAGPHFDLTQLTQSLSQLSQSPTFAKNFAQSFARNVVQNPPVYDPYSYLMRATSNYDSFKKPDGSKNDNSNSEYVIRRPKPQKVKSVEIIEDPRFTSYKVNS